MSKRLFAVVVAVTIFILIGAMPAPVAAGEADSEPADLSTLRGSAKVNALIDQVTEKQRTVHSMRATFTQRKNSSLLLEEMEASGELSYVAPDRVRWDFSTPDAMVIVVADDTVTTFHPDAARAQKVKISGNSRRLVGVFAGTQSLDELRTQFKITLSDPGAPHPYRLTLDPIHRTVKKKLQNLLLEVDRELLLPVVVEYLEADGDSTRYEFTGVQVNPEIQDAAFLLELGDEVSVETIDATSGAG